MVKLKDVWSKKVSKRRAFSEGVGWLVQGRECSMSLVGWLVDPMFLGFVRFSQGSLEDVEEKY